MSTWQGWQKQLLDAAGLPTSEITQEFLYEWSQRATSDCRNNPVDVSHNSATSKDCHKLTAHLTAQAYPSHAAAAHSFAQQINSGQYPHLHAALQANVPLNQPHPNLVVDDLDKWGSARFAAWYQSHSSTGTGQGIGGVTQPKAARALHGWADLRRSVNHNLPGSLHNAQHTTAAGLRVVNRARKVKL